MRSRFVLLIAILLLAGCQKSETTEPAPPPPSATAAAAAPQTQIAQGLETPESVLYDPDQDVYFISNINGDPRTVDNNGFISRVNPDTLQGEMRWIESGKNGVTLNAPKGMAIAGDILYVADLTAVRRFDRKSGAPKGEIAIKGATTLNDVASDGTTVYVSQTGLNAADGAIFKITGDAAQKIGGGADLEQPNGLVAADGKLWVASLGGKDLYQLDNGKKTNAVPLPEGSLDGLLRLADGTFLVTSWDAKTVYRGPQGGPFTAALENANSPADIGYDSKRHRLLLPHLMDSIVTIHPLQ